MASSGGTASGTVNVAVDNNAHGLSIQVQSDVGTVLASASKNQSILRPKPFLARLKKMEDKIDWQPVLEEAFNNIEFIDID